MLEGFTQNERLKARIITIRTHASSIIRAAYSIPLFPASTPMPEMDRDIQNKRLVFGTLLLPGRFKGANEPTGKNFNS